MVMAQMRPCRSRSSVVSSSRSRVSVTGDNAQVAVVHLDDGRFELGVEAFCHGVHLVAQRANVDLDVCRVCAQMGDESSLLAREFELR